MEKDKNKTAQSMTFNKEELLRRRRRQLYATNAFLNEYFGILIILIVIMVFYLSFSFLIKPKYQKILAKINDNVVVQNQVFPKYLELSNSKKLNDAYSQISSENISRIQGLVPKEVGRQELFAEILYLLSRQGIKVSDLQVAKDGESLVSTSTPKTPARPSTPGTERVSPASPTVSLPSGVGYYNIDIELAGVNYSSFKKALLILENSLRLVDIRSLSFDPGQNIASLQLTTYYVKDSVLGQTPEPVDIPVGELNIP